MDASSGSMCVLSVSDDGTLIVWDASRGAYVHTLSGLYDAVIAVSVHVAVLSGRMHAVSGSRDETLIV